MPSRSQRRSTPRIAIDSRDEAYSELLHDRGIEYFFGHGGTDFAPLVEVFARSASQGGTTPKPMTVPQEYVPVSMTDGFYRVTGRPHAVMVLVIVGTANAAGAIMNAARAQIPILFSAGRTPITESELRGARNAHIHWAQEAFDQGSPGQEFVKWDYELRNFAQVETVVDRALEIAMVEPRGPVYLTLPREVLAEEHTELSYVSPSRHSTESPRYPTPGRIKEAVQALGSGQSSLIVTQRVGSHPTTVKSLMELAGSFAIPVLSPVGMYMHFPSNHPLHLGYDSEPLVQEADVILVIDADVPWFPATAKLRDSATVIQMGIDPFFSRYPVRGYPCDIPIVTHPSVVIPLLTQELARSRVQVERTIVERLKHIKAHHEGQEQAARERLTQVRDERPIEFEWVSPCINQVKDDETILMNESDLNLVQVQLTQPGSYYAASPAAGLGWGLGAALGMKLAAPTKTVIATVGEGACMVGCPTAKRATKGVYPNGWAAKTDTWPLTDLMPSPSFERMADVHDAYGELVEDPAEALPALRRGLNAVHQEK